VVVLTIAILAPLAMAVAAVTKTTTVADLANPKVAAMSARAVLTTALQVPLHLAAILAPLAVTSVAVTTAVAHRVVTSEPLAVTSAVAMTVAALPVVTSVRLAATSVPVSQPSASLWVPSLVTAEKYLYPVTLRSVPHALHVNSSSAL
jgi:hypothetical protein